MFTGKERRYGASYRPGTALHATVYSLERLRCVRVGRSLQRRSQKAWGDKYDENAAAMIAQLKYGAGTPFYRLEQTGGADGIHMPAATQWRSSKRPRSRQAALDKLISIAAQGSVVHNDDTGMRVLTLKRDPEDERTGSCLPAGSSLW